MTSLDKALLAHYGHAPTCDLIATECHPECNCRCTCAGPGLSGEITSDWSRWDGAGPE